ncbi:MAG: hypothetical protein GOMPHAMPRED_005469 [Gomphillus americanus]|uniref:Uncharacterized protein n=1 Tax=Gomphillus americanus TaxID=1940652 RepID=A0A8H3IVG2_9LECA|nr:MAG: hypothetical protein GOMPHAMPRED_005469 [Gomphillus americanus]
MTSPATQAQARSVYRSILRELPQRSISSPSPLKLYVRSHLINPPARSKKSIQQQLRELEQFVQYSKAQRVYATLLEQYNPGMSMDEEERVKLTMKRVGMHAPDEWKPE